MLRTSTRGGFALALGLALALAVLASGCVGSGRPSPAGTPPAPPPTALPAAGTDAAVAGPAPGGAAPAGEGVPRLEVGTLEQAMAATGLRVAPPSLLPAGTGAGPVRWAVGPRQVFQEFTLPDGRALVYAVSGEDVAYAPAGRRLEGHGVVGFLSYTAPEAGDTVSPGITRFDWRAGGLQHWLQVEGPPEEEWLLSVAASVAAP